jgi:hypothetical protein
MILWWNAVWHVALVTLLENSLHIVLSSNLESVNNIYSPEQDVSHTIYKEFGATELNTKHPATTRPVKNLWRLLM